MTTCVRSDCSGVEAVEAPEVVLDRRTSERLKPPRRHSREAWRAASTVPVAADCSWSARPTGEAVDDAEAVHQALEVVARRGEALRHALVGDDRRAAVGEQPARVGECLDGAGHVVQGLEDR